MKNKSDRLGTEKVRTLLINLSLPATVGMIVNALYNVVDTIFIGWGVNTLAIGGLAIAFPLQMIIMAFALMIGVGAASAVSRCLGRGNRERAEKVAGNAFFSIILLSSTFMILGLIFVEPLLRIFGATETLLPYAKEYITVIFAGSVFFSFAVASNNLIRAEGNAKVAMLSMVIGTGLNIILDPIFIFPLKMGIRGAALATIISQFVSFVYVLFYLYSGKSILRLKFHHLKPEKEIIKEILAVGSSALARQIAGSIMALVLNNSLKVYGGDQAITIFGIINKLLAFLFMPMFGVVQGMQPIIGFNYGAKKIDRVRETIKLSLLTVTMIGGLTWLIAEIFSPQIIAVFTAETEIIISGSKVMRIIFAAAPVIGVQIVGAGLFQSLGKAVPSLILTISRQILMFIPLVLILPRFFGWGLLGIWLAFPIADLLSTIVTGLFLRSQLKKIITVQKTEDAYQ